METEQKLPCYDHTAQQQLYFLLLQVTHELYVAEALKRQSDLWPKKKKKKKKNSPKLRFAILKLNEQFRSIDGLDSNFPLCLYV